MEKHFQVVPENINNVRGKQVLNFTHVCHAKNVIIDINPHIGSPPPANLGILLMEVTKILRDINGPATNVPTHEDIARALSKAFEKC